MIDNKHTAHNIYVEIAGYFIAHIITNYHRLDGYTMTNSTNPGILWIMVRTTINIDTAMAILLECNQISLMFS